MSSSTVDRRAISRPPESRESLVKKCGGTFRSRRFSLPDLKGYCCGERLTEALASALPFALAFAFTGDSKLRGCAALPASLGGVGFCTSRPPVSEPDPLALAEARVFGFCSLDVLDAGAVSRAESSVPARLPAALPLAVACLSLPGTLGRAGSELGADGALGAVGASGALGEAGAASFTESSDPATSPAALPLAAPLMPESVPSVVPV